MKYSFHNSWKDLFHNEAGKSYSSILKYFAPEFITALILYSLPYFVDCFFIGNLKSTELYTISGVVDNFLNMFVKIAEGLSIGTVAIAGYHNGLKQDEKVGKSFVDSFWTSVFIGGIISSLLYSGGYFIYKYFNFSEHTIQLGLPFLKIRAASMFCIFVFFSFVGFLRSIKNTVVPMILFGIGAIVFISFDYCLIFGNFGFPALGLQGSAVSYLMQYIVMTVCAAIYVFCFSVNRKYKINILSGVSSLNQIIKLLGIALPIVVDKAVMAGAYVWLASMIAPMGQYALANFSVIKLMERMAFVPAVAFSQVITFLVSNDMGKGNAQSIRANIIKVMVLASIMVSILLLIGSLFPVQIISLIDQKREFGQLAAKVFPALSVLVFFDLLQLILSGALRGASDVQTVMLTRVFVIGFYFMPVSYGLSQLSIASDSLKFFLIYGSFFIGNALMSVIYIKRFAKGNWNCSYAKVNND